MEKIEHYDVVGLTSLDITHKSNVFVSTIASGCTSYGIIDVPAYGGMWLFSMFRLSNVNVIAFESIRSCTLCSVPLS